MSCRSNRCRLSSTSWMRWSPICSSVFEGNARSASWRPTTSRRKDSSSVTSRRTITLWFIRTTRSRIHASWAPSTVPMASRRVICTGMPLSSCTRHVCICSARVLKTSCWAQPKSPLWPTRCVTAAFRSSIPTWLMRNMRCPMMQGAGNARSRSALSVASVRQPLSTSWTRSFAIPMPVAIRTTSSWSLNTTLRFPTAPPIWW